MKIKSERLMEIIKEELDDITRDLYSKDREESVSIMKAQDAIKELRTTIEQIKATKHGEIGYADGNGPDLDQQIIRMESAISQLEMNIHSSLTNLHQMKQNEKK
jgi:Na+/phosphate symporter